MDIKYKTLDKKAAWVLLHFNRLGQSAFTSEEAYALLSMSTKDAVRKLLQNMVNRGLLLRLKDGVFWIIPYEEDPDSYFPNWHLIVKNLVGNADYYVGFFSAFEIHGLNTQPSLLEKVVVNKQIKPAVQEVKGVKFQFIYLNVGHFFGQKQLWIDSYNKVSCSDLEKTIVDALYKPDYAGGLSEIAKAVHRSRNAIDYNRLFEYCARFNAQSVIKRLGFLLEILEIDNPIIEALHRIRSKSMVALEPSYEKKGKWLGKWSLLQNIDTSDIISPIFT